MKRALSWCVVLSACSHPAAEEAAPRVRKVSCGAVVSKQVRDVVELRGTVAPRPERDAMVAAQVAGRVLRVDVREGDAVVKGAVLARIDGASLGDAAQQAEAALGKARAEKQNADTSLTRTTHVFERGIAARQEVDDATTRAAAATAAEQDAIAAANQARRQLSRAVLTSPIAGVVLKGFRRPGALVDGTPTTPVVEVADLSDLELVADAPASDLVRLTTGSSASIAFAALPGSYSGKVSLVSRSVDKTSGVGTVRIAIETGKNASPPVGLYGVATVDRGEPHDASLIPSTALRRDASGGAAILVCGSDHLAHVLSVEVGASHDGLVEARGAPKDARIAISPTLGINDGDPIDSAP